jgi:hypothetical protein
MRPVDAGELPARFIVGANVKRWRSGGRLVVAPGSIAFETGSMLRAVTSVALVVHTDPRVTLITSRLALPWLNTHLVLFDENNAVVASTWPLARRRLRRALHAAGFAVDEVKTWFSWGDNLRAQHEMRLRSLDGV